MKSLAIPTPARNAGLERLRARETRRPTVLPSCLSCGGTLGWMDEPERADGLCKLCRLEIAEDMRQGDAAARAALGDLAAVRRILAPVFPGIPLPCTCTRGTAPCDRCTVEGILCPAPTTDAPAAHPWTAAEHAAWDAEAARAGLDTDCPF
jgi:hypothetical protein